MLLVKSPAKLLKRTDGVRDVVLGSYYITQENGQLAVLHQNSKSPQAKIGFHVTTYTGNLPQGNERVPSWDPCFAKSMRRAPDLEVEAKGPDPAFNRPVPALFEKVISRLLRPFESDCWSLRPSLVHGDLWYANSRIHAGTIESLIFDACSF